VRIAFGFIALRMALSLPQYSLQLAAAGAVGQACSAPTYLGICNPYVPGTFIKVSEKGAIPVLGTWYRGPAERAGICPGDKIVAVNGIGADVGWATLQHELISSAPTPVRLKIQRSPQTFEVTVPRVRETALAALSGMKFIHPASTPPEASVGVADYVTEEDVRSVITFRKRPIVQLVPDRREPSPTTYITGFGALWDEQRHEAVTDYIDPPSPAFAAGLHPGSEILAINGRAVSSLTRDQVAKLLSPTSTKPISLRIERERQQQTVTIVPVRYKDVLASIGRKLTRFGPAPLTCPD